jgi:SAM-dependent methyltransferase
MSVIRENQSITNKIKRRLVNLFTYSVHPKSYFYFSAKGYCPCCDKNTVFRATDSWLRDNFLCSNCLSIPRERAFMLTVEKYYPNWNELNIHESSPENRGASLKIQKFSSSYTATQFFCNENRGSIINGFRNEDLENQTFDDASFDLVITQDVFEHVYNPGKAFKEIARTLKKGGAHIFTTPLVNKFAPSEVWATLGENGKPIFLKEPEYHGNPINAEGSPVTMHWGYDIIDFIKKHSGLETTIEYIDNLKYGIRAEFIEVLVSRKI